MPEQEEPRLDDHEKHNHLLYFLQHLRDRMRFDTITAQIGPNAQGVIVGKNIIQIGSLQIPMYLIFIFALGTIVVVTAVITILYILLPPSVMPEGNFNIAVAEFVAIDQDGKPTSNLEARERAAS